MSDITIHSVERIDEWFYNAKISVNGKAKWFTANDESQEWEEMDDTNTDDMTSDDWEALSLALNNRVGW